MILLGLGWGFVSEDDLEVPKGMAHEDVIVRQVDFIPILVRPPILPHDVDLRQSPCHSLPELIRGLRGSHGADQEERGRGSGALRLTLVHTIRFAFEAK